MAFEAFVNFCGFVLLPNRWENEREEFRGQGVDGKVAAIAEQLPKFEFRKGHEPYQVIGSERRPFDDRVVAAEALERHRQTIAP